MDKAKAKGLIGKTTLSEQVRNYIFTLIDTHRLGPGDEVPSEIQLIEELGVSRGVIREAFRSLAALGVLDIGSGKRPRVQSFNPEALAMIFRYAMATQQVSAKQVLEMRRTLEIGSVGLAAKHGTRRELAAVAREMDNIRNTFGRPEEFVIHDALFHVAIAEASHNPLYSLMLRALRGALERSIIAGLNARPHNDSNETIISLHQDIVTCLMQHDAEGAMRAMAEHFDSAVQALIHAKET